MKRSWGYCGIAAGFAAVLSLACATVPKDPAAGGKGIHPQGAEDASGVEVVGLRPAAGGRLLDFRFRVVDPGKAAALLDRRVAAYLVNERTGERMEVPSTKVGTMRQSTPRPDMYRVYYMLFNAAGRRIGPEDRFTVVVGPHRFENLTVQQGRGDHP